MRAMHKGLHRPYGTSPHDTRATIKAVYSLSYKMPAPVCMVTAHINKWLGRHAYWDGDRYASWRVFVELVVQGITGDWCTDYSALDVLIAGCSQADCVCVSAGGPAETKTKSGTKD